MPFARADDLPHGIFGVEGRIDRAQCGERGFDGFVKGCLEVARPGFIEFTIVQRGGARGIEAGDIRAVHPL